MLQVPELQLAMGFDEGYKLLKGSRRDRIKLLGNGVCPPMMRDMVAALTGTTKNVLSCPLPAPDLKSRANLDLVGT